jgi:hypothetical protein
MPKGMDPRTWRQTIEKELNALFDKATALITALDCMEADTEDLEDGADAEPYLGGWSGYNDDREADDCDLEDDGTAEPSLGWTNHRDQTKSMAMKRGWFFDDGEEDAGDMAEVPAYGD